MVGRFHSFRQICTSGQNSIIWANGLCVGQSNLEVVALATTPLAIGQSNLCKGCLLLTPFFPCLTRDCHGGCLWSQSSLIKTGPLPLELLLDSIDCISGGSGDGVGGNGRWFFGWVVMDR